MHIKAAQLLKIMPRAKKGNYRDYLKYINQFSSEFGINTPLRMAHYLAQVAHESAELRYTEEIASGEAYEGRLDLGNTQPGDGKKFKGRGLLQLTGRANYEAYKKYCGYDVVNAPDLLIRPLGAVRSSMWFFCDYKKLLKYADVDDVITISKRINGGLNGVRSRVKYLARAKEALGV